MIQPQPGGGALSASLPLALENPSLDCDWLDSDRHNYLAFVQHLHKSGYMGAADMPGMAV